MSRLRPWNQNFSGLRSSDSVRFIESVPNKSSGLIEDNWWVCSQRREVLAGLRLSKHEHKQQNPRRSARRGLSRTDPGFSLPAECRCRASEGFPTCSLRAQPHQQCQMLHHQLRKKHLCGASVRFLKPVADLWKVMDVRGGRGVIVFYAVFAFLQSDALARGSDLR